MKKALKLLLMYFVLLFSIIILGTLIYAIHLNIQNFIVGTENRLFNNMDLLRSVFFVSFCALLLICPFVSYYRGRHTGGISQTIVYIVLVLVTWGVFFPGLTLLSKFYETRHKAYVVEAPLSGGYFRSTGNNVYYFTRDFYSNPITFDDTTTVIINTENNGSVSVEKIKDTPDFELYAAAEPYKDILIRNTFQKEGVPYSVNFSAIIDYARYNFSRGWTFYLGFCSLGLLLASVYALTGLFKWRLINSCFIVVATIISFTFNSLYLDGVMGKLVGKVEQIGFIAFLSKIFSDPFLVLVNVIFSLAFIITGIITMSVRNHHKKAGGR